MKRASILSFLLLVLSLIVLPQLALAQVDDDSVVQRDPIRVECGNVIESEFRTGFEDHQYIIALNAGDRLQTSADPFGDQLKLNMNVTSPVGLVISVSDGEISSSGEYTRLDLESQSVIDTGILSASGEYSIWIHNYQWIRYVDDSGGIGVYTVYISCTLRDGTEIAAGSVPVSAAPGPIESAPPTVEAPAFGFPGLPPVDFSSVVRIPMIDGAPMTGVITPSGGEILGFSTSGNASDVLDLQFRRLSGNLNLGIVVISETNQTVFQTSMIASDTFSTQITLPFAGEYIVAAYQIALLPPGDPMGTAFELQFRLNP